MKNKHIFQNRIIGLTSVVFKNDELFPVLLEPIIEHLPMNAEYQYPAYLEARTKERREDALKQRRSNRKQILSISQGKSFSTFRKESRRISNYYTHTNAQSPKTIDELKVYSSKITKMMENISKHNNKGLAYSQFVEDGVNKIALGLKVYDFEEFDLKTISNVIIGGDDTNNNTSQSISSTIPLTLSGGDDDNILNADIIEENEEHETSDKQYDASPELESTMKEIEQSTNKPIQDNIVFDDETVKMQDIFDDVPEPLLDIDPVEVTKRARSQRSKFMHLFNKIGKRPRFVLIHGSLNLKTRALYQEIFNDPVNQNGEYIKMFIVSSVGAEGLSLIAVRHVHILEPYWSDSRHVQIYHRAVRMGSHLMLQLADRNVQPYIYIAVHSQGRTVDLPKNNDNNSNDNNNELTSDEHILELALNRRQLIDAFTTAIHEVAINCVHLKGVACRMCVANNKPLYDMDIYKDLQRKHDQCQQIKEEETEAKEVMYDGERYYYDLNDQSVFGVTIYKHDPALNLYKKVKEDNPLFTAIFKQIKLK